MHLLERIVARIEPASSEHVERARARQRELTKPPGSLGRLESLAADLTGIQRNDWPETFGRRIVVFAADHGVTEERVSPYPSEVTGQMLENFVAGGAAINALAGVAGAEVRVVDVGVRHPPENVRGSVPLVSSAVRPGSRNLAREPAMTEAELEEALEIGASEARRAARDRIALAGLGEMGIGNTTAASAVAAVLTGLPVQEVTGPGTGLDAPGVEHKVEVIERALALHALTAEKPLRVLQCVGGLELAALTGFCLEAAALRLAIVVDGFITTAAFTVAWRLSPLVKDYAFFSHLSPERGHRRLLELVGAKPLLDLDLRLGEGTGAALAMSILEAAAAAHSEMATFASAGVSERPS